MSAKTRIGNLRRRGRALLEARRTVLADHIGFVDDGALWVGISQGVEPGDRLALEDPASGRTVALGAPAAPGHELACSVDVREHASWVQETGPVHVVLLRGSRAVRIRPAVVPLPGQRPVAIPITRDGEYVFRPRLVPAFTFTVEPRAAAAPVEEVAAVGSELTLTVRVPGDRPVTVVHRLGRGGRVLREHPATPDEGGLVRLVIDQAEVPDADALLLSVVVDGAELPVVRSELDLRDPSYAVAMPWLPAADRASTIVVTEFAEGAQVALRRREILEEGA